MIDMINWFAIVILPIILIGKMIFGGLKGWWEYLGIFYLIYLVLFAIF